VRPRSGRAAGPRRAAALGALALVPVLAGGAPAQATSGLFLYVDGTTGLPAVLVAPEEKACVVAPKGSGAYNLTGSDVILYSDLACQNYLLVLVPWESLNLPFNSVGFVPAGGRAAPPAQSPAPLVR
jgi:hypothetical protein